MEPLQWLFSLYDKLSGPAQHMAKALDDVGSSAQAASGGTAKVGEAMDSAGAHAHSAVGETSKLIEVLEKLEKKLGGGEKETHKLLDFEKAKEGLHLLHEGLDKAIELGRELAEKAIEIGKEMLTAAGAGERMELSFKLLLGEDAEKTLAYLEKIAGPMGLRGSQAKQMAVPLINAGIRGEGMEQAFAAAGDVAAMQGGDPAAMQNAVGMFARIKEMGQIQGRALVGMGLAEADVLRNLAERLGTTSEVAKKQMEGRKVATDDLLQAVYKSIADKVGGGELGQGALQGGSTLDALLNKVKGIPEAFYEKLAGGQGVNQVKGFLANLAELFDPSSAFGSKVATRIDEIFTSVVQALVGDMSGPDGIKVLEQRLEGALEKADQFIASFREAWPEVKADFEAALPALKAVAEVIADIVKGLAALPKFGESLVDSSATAVDDAAAVINMPQGGHTVMDDKDQDALLERAGKGGLWHWLGTTAEESQQEALEQSYKEMGLHAGQGFQDGVRESLQIHSPSKVMENLGDMARAGFDDGMDLDTMGQVAVPDPDLPEGGGRAGSRVHVGDKVVQVTLQMQVDGGAHHDADELAEAVLQRVEARLPGAIITTLETLDEEGGGGGV